MNDDRLVTEAEDDRVSAVIAADDTGMISGERLITEAEMDEGLQDEEA
ncbi:MAG: hypothetical protein ABR591_15125 [Candidatus Velthaea sp.]